LPPPSDGQPHFTLASGYTADFGIATNTDTMADSDPISDYTPAKRQKTSHPLKTWDEANDSGDDLFEEHETVATLPVASSQRPQLGYSSKQFHNDLNTLSSGATQPTQPITQTNNTFVTQPTQPLKRSSAESDDVQVQRSSPPPAITQPPSKPQASFAKPRSFLASAMAPPGTNFRRPQGVQSRPPAIPVDDSDEDPEIQHHSSDEETQGLKSNIRPTNFTKGGRGLNSSPNRRSVSREETVVRESPKPARAPHPNGFLALMAGFEHKETASKPSRPADDMASAYGGTSRGARPPQKQGSATSPYNAVVYKTLDDIQDYTMRKQVEGMLAVLGESKSVQRCHEALVHKRGNKEDAMNWLVEQDTDELAPTPMKAGPKGVARTVAQAGGSSQLSQPPVRSTARADVKVQAKSIAERYGNAKKQAQPTQSSQPSQPTQPTPTAIQIDDDDDEEEDAAPRPRKRLIQRKRPEMRSPSPVTSAPQTQVKPAKKATITIDSDGSDVDHDSGNGSGDEVEIVGESSHDIKLLKFFNEATLAQIADLCASPESDVQLLIDKRPFNTLDEIRALTNAPEFTKSGKKSRTKPIGDKIVDGCSDMMKGYDAVDDLVTECEQIAKPIQDSLKSWGVGEGAGGELQIMNLEEAHDSGIGTPASSTDELSASLRMNGKGKKGKFLSQPENMSADITMKDYQLVGLNWLHLLWDKKISCILADDMGLGKTCQVISFLSQLQLEKVDGVHLVIVPGSTLENWLREFRNFSPELNVVPYYGSQAERPTLQDHIEENFNEIDVIVTTYDMTVKPDDNRFLRNLGPSVCVYDEAHALRNPKSDRYRQLMRIPADFKVLLTGTPLQNNLQELIAILAFIMPGLFHSKEEDLNYIFQHKATTKDADHAALLSAQRIARARSMMTPFILRRKKAQVLWLPAKHSRVEFCDMTESQAVMYQNEMYDAQQVFLDKEAGKKTTAKASSNVLMNLRKAAIHPLLSRRIYDDKKLTRIQSALLRDGEFAGNAPEKVWKYLTGEGPQNIKGGDFGLHRFCAERPFLSKYALKKQEWMDCGKVQKFKELVLGYKKNGDRALVFSQFTTLMDILETVLETLDIRYMRLDGSTRMDIRQDMIDKFSSEPDITVFMLSTKAGGAGINLAAANKVIIFDSGFNPQDDIQAENRAHRVGQTRDVDVVRLVTKATIEEQIHALGESKLALDERVAGEAATAGEDKAAEKEGEKAVEKMFLESLKGKKEEDEKEKKGSGEKEKKASGEVEKKGGDLKQQFKKGLSDAGLEVS
jgi:SWI/SNF-related matrix-associated actin-dependent regulator 1 of chromatin subfamily A